METQSYQCVFSIIKLLCFCNSRKLCVYNKNTAAHNILQCHIWGVSGNTCWHCVVQYNSSYKPYIMCLAPRLQWRSCVRQHGQTLPEISPVHYTFDFKLISGSCALPNTLVSPSFSLPPMFSYEVMTLSLRNWVVKTLGEAKHSLKAGEVYCPKQSLGPPELWTG